MHELFEEQVKQTPEAVAVECADERLSYAELNRRANRLAHHLRHQGVKLEDRVGICVERGVEMVVGLLGILKAGGACVPIDPDYPRQLHQHILDNAAAEFLITQRAVCPDPAAHRATIIWLDQEWEETTHTTLDNPERLTKPEHLAYVLHCGRRTTFVEHHTVGKRLRSLAAECDIAQSDSMLHRASLTDISAVPETLLPLLNGARIVITDRPRESDPMRLLGLIEKHQITIAHFPSSILPDLMTSKSSNARAQLTTLRSILCTGPALKSAIVEEILGNHKCVLHHYYVPVAAATEVAGLRYQIGQEDSSDSLIVSSTGNLSIYVLDDDRHPVPAGVKGEIYVGGASLSRTGSREERVCLEGHPEINLVSTGDIGCRRQDGRLEIFYDQGTFAWLGEYNVATEDIEAALLADLSVKECAVLVCNGPDSIKQLRAYLVSTGSWEPDRYRKHLASSLPAFMLPASYIPVARLPLTQTGEIDLKALAQLPVVDSPLISRCEEQLNGMPEIAQAAIVAHSFAPESPRLHLADLVSGWKSGAMKNSGLAQELAESSISESSSEQETTTVAFADGGPLSIPDDAPKTLTEALFATAKRYPNKGIFHITGSEDVHFQSYPALLEDARRVLAGLHAKGLKAGDRVILQCESLPEHFSCFWACVLGGIIPVNIAVPPSYADRNGVVNKLYNVWKLLEGPFLIGGTSLITSLPSLEKVFPGDKFRVLSAHDLLSNSPTDNVHPSRPEDLVFLQLTSGSTGTPKCIQESHRGVVAHIHASAQFNGYSPDDVVLNWLPVDHVVPTLTMNLKDVYLGCQEIQVATNVVLSEPTRWLDSMDVHRVTHSWAPNFGFKLVADALARTNGKHWDLSSVKFLMNAGEQVTLTVVSDFLDRTAPFGIKPSVMQPAFGMAEVCTCMTYANDFRTDSGAHWFLKSSLSGALRPSAPADSAAIAFVDLGPPMPGVQIRITDAQNNVLPEGRIGRFQIKGDVVTQGYLLNDDANREAFVGNGWFNSGDLGFMWNGRLMLTGREKEIIIIRGANFYAYEIEAVVNSIPGVLPTFSAATAVIDPNAGTEGLAVFFVPQTGRVEQKARLVNEIRKIVANNLGISPAFVVPLAQNEFAKTTSGKIQRNQMRRLLESGDYNSILKELDLELENENTLPGWFYQKTWRRKTIETGAVAGPGGTVMFVDSLGLGERVREKMMGSGQKWITVHAGTKFEQIESDHFQFDPGNREDYRRVFSAIAAQGTPITQVLHLATYGGIADQWWEPNQFDSSVDGSLIPMLYLIQGLNVLPESHHPIRLLVTSSHSQSIRKGDQFDCTRGAITGLLKTASQELPWLQWGHVDLPGESVDEDVALVLMELKARDRNCERAWRDGRRWVPKLYRVDFSRTSKRKPLPFTQGGFYLITGGLGGIGTHLAKFLLSNYQARLLVVGRTPLSDQTGSSASSDKANERRKVYEELGRLGCVDYREVDVSDSASLQAAVEDVKRRWNAELAGIVHLAGVYQERGLVDETKKSLDIVLRPKLQGLLALHRLIAHSPQALFLSFGSVNGFLGGFSVGAYSIANAFQDSFADFQRELGLRSYCLNWSLWEDTGMSRGLAMKEAARARGYYGISHEQGIQSMLAVLHRDCIHPFIGLDAGKEAIRQHCEDSSPELQRLRAYFVPRNGAVAVAALEQLIPMGCKLQQLERMPINSSGEIDRDELTRLARRGSEARREFIGPRTELERQIARIWQGLLGVKQIGIQDNFFELGGHSLLATQVVARVRELTRTNVEVGRLFANPSLEKFVEAIGQQQQEDANPYVGGIQAMTRSGAIPLSFAQQRLWFLAQFEGIRATYHIPLALRLRGALDRAALRRALDTVFARHEALRSVFVAVDGEPQVRLLPETTGLPLIEHDLRGHENASVELARLGKEEARAPFDLAQGPLIRSRLVQLADDDHVLLLTQHHIVSDGWSIGVLSRELTTLYQAFQQGQANPLPPLTIQYPDYAAWQRGWLSGERLERQTAYWREALTGAPALLELPTDRPRPAQPDHSGARVPILLDAELTRSLKQLSQRHGTTLFMTVLAAWAVVLSRLSGQDDVVIGTPTANRGRVEMEGLIGFFISTLSLRIQLDDSPSVSELLSRVRKTALAAQEHQDLSFEQVVEIVQPPRRLNHNPIFQVQLNWQNNEVSLPEFAGVQVTLPVTADEVLKFDLQLSLSELNEQIVGSLAYATALFDATTIERHVGYLQAALRAMVSNSEQRVAAIELLSEEERRLQLETWNATAAEYPQDRCIHELFEEQVRKSPEARAVVHEDRVLSYSELNAQANRLAYYLRGLGAGPDDRVAICVDRSAAMVIGLLAILKAGAAYVPLDPAYPSGRLSQIVADAAPSLLLIDAVGQAALGEAASAGRTLVDLEPLRDGSATAWSSQPVENPQVPGLTSRHLAYVIYTSGSTGTPKGVMGLHLPVINLIEWVNSRFKIGPEDVVLFTSSLSFDLSVYDIFGLLAAGGSLYVASHDEVTDPQRLARILFDGGVTLWDSAPAVFQQLLFYFDEASRTKESAVRLAFFSGDWIPLEFYDVIRRFFPRCEMIGLGGATEATVWSNFYPVTHLDPAWASIPYGRPIQNARYYVLDSYFNPLPIGSRGDLYIGGECLTAGYFDQPDLTAERYLSDPHSNTPHGKMYKTGDLARYRSDGNLEFLGRNDFQVKIRGFRIELGEIEARLAESPDVRESVVIAHKEASGEKRLLAYVVPADEAVNPAELAAALRTYMTAHLPDYMVPSAFVRIQSLPLTPNGKLDRDRLPAPDGEAYAQPLYEAPQGSSEIIIARVWQELLNVERVGRNDNFFELGGHSLLAVRLVERLHQENLEIDVRSLFVSPILRDFALSTNELEEVRL